MNPAIRMVTAADAEPVRDIYAPIVEHTHISFEVDPPSVGEMAQRIENTTERLPWLVCEHRGQVVGYSYASPHKGRSAYQWAVDVSVYVDEGWRRRGVARGLYESLFELLRLQGLYNAYAVIALPNGPSVRFHEALGFERIGTYRNVGYKDGTWRDVGHWGQFLQPHETPPAPPVPIAELQHTDGFTEALLAGERQVQT